jgi:putative pyruvate formate lyase activating enzyme
VGQMPYWPSYLYLLDSGMLASRVEEAYESLRECCLCPRECGLDRLAGDRGFCQSGVSPVVASHTLHYMEEPVISGTRGSGAVFFSNCVLRCTYCQNFPISQLGVGNEVTVKQLAEMMLHLQHQGAHNINLVTPTHFVPQLLAAVHLAALNNLRLPIVYNSGGYDSMVTLRLLDGVVDIYLPDAKYASNDVAARYSKAGGYVESNRAALKEMHRQVGDVQVDREGLATRGLIIRHLVLPGGLAGTAAILKFIRNQISHSASVSLMDQYFPTPRVASERFLNRKVTWEEWDQALLAFEESGLENGWVQEHVCEESDALIGVE